MPRKDKLNRGIWVYDIETFGNFFSCIYYNIDTLSRRDFIVCEWQDDLADFIEFTLDKDLMKGMIGFNNLNFDYSVIHEMITKPHMFRGKTGDEKAKIIKTIANSVIEAEFSSIADKNVLIPQLDLYSLNHFFNPAKRTSLKQCELAMRWHNLQDLPFPHDHNVSQDEIEGVMGYNFNDVLATHQLYIQCLPKIELRKKLSKKYGINLINADDTKMGSEIFAKFICSKKGITWYQLKNQRTYRDEIKLSECIFDYIKFKTPTFQALLEFFNKQVIVGTKSVFGDIPLKECKELHAYADPVEIKNGVLRTLKLRFNDEVYALGTGGLHMSCKPGVYEVDENHEIIDIDVASYYPNIAIKNKIFPEHLGLDFCEVYEDVYNQRKAAKKAGDDTTDAGLKLLLNSVFGKSGSEHSYLMDKKFLLSITVPGQLLLLMLVEELVKISKILQCNTDGITVRIHKNNVAKMRELIKWWEDFTQLTLEDVSYKKMAINNVNNYLSVYTNNKVKYKGAYEIDKEMKGEIQYHKNHSKRIVPLAASLYFTDGIPVRDTIMNHLTNGDYYNGSIKNHGIFDFYCGVKTKGGIKGVPKMVLKDFTGGNLTETVLQKTNRYYISKKGGHLVKQYRDGSEAQIEANPQRGRYYKIVIANQHQEKEDYNIDYTYYIREADKLINSIVDFNYSLF